MLGKVHAADVLDARATAIGLLQEWGTFTHRSKRVRDLLAIEFLSKKELREIQRLLKATTAKHAATMIEHKDKVVEGVTWTDEDVERCIIQLTNADADLADLPNDVGWNKPHSPIGHWCFAMLKTDRALAIKVGRGIVGGYTRQFQPSGRKAA